MTALAFSRMQPFMGRKPLDMTLTSFRLEPEILARIDARVGSRGRAQFVRDALRKQLDELDEEDVAVADALAKVRASRGKPR